MKHSTRKVATTLAVLGTAGAAVVGSTFLSPQSAQANVSNAQFMRRNERQPIINNAIAKLRDAQRDCRNANRDFGGHRAKAAQLIDQAIAQLQQAKRYDDNH